MKKRNKIKEISYYEHEVTKEEMKESMVKLLKDKNDEAFVNFAFNLLNSKVYSVANERILLSLDKEGNIPNERVMDFEILHKFKLYNVDEKRWIPIFLSKEDALEAELPNDAVVVGLEFYYLCERMWVLADLEGFNIDPLDVGLRLTKEYIETMYKIKELIDKED